MIVKIISLHFYEFYVLIILICCQVVGAVFDLPEEIARELLTKELPAGNTITKITKVSFLLGFIFPHHCEF